nr:EOG090X0131 [Triops cancriformis]
MHEAFEATPILEKLPLQIECICAYEDRLLVGTKQGHLLMYSVLQSVSSPLLSSSTKCEVQLLGSNKYFSKKPIVQLQVIPEHQILISLSDNCISVHDLSVFNFPLITVVQKTRGATLFSLDVKKVVSLTGETAVTVRLAVCVKRKLQLYYWKNREFHELGPDLTIPDTPKSLSWVHETLCLGFRGEYVLIKLDAGAEQRDLFPTGRQLEPVIALLQIEREHDTTFDKNWEKLSKEKENCFALGRDDQIIFVDAEGSPLRKTGLTWSEPPLEIVQDAPYLISVLPSYVEIRSLEPRLLIQRLELPRARFICSVPSRHGLIYCASPSHVWALQQVPVHKQLAPLLQEKHFELAIHLANLSDEPSDIKTHQVQHIQSLYAFELFRNKKFHESMKIFLKLNTDASHVIGLFPDLLPAEFRKQLKYPEDIPVLKEKELESGLLALIEFLTQVRHDLMGNLNPQKSTPAALVEGNTLVKSKRQLLQIVDTTLLKCYLQTNDALVASLLRLKDNHCHLEESRQALQAYNKHAELILLYQSRGMHQDALEELKECRNSKEQGYEATITYLQHLGPEYMDLILKFASWVLTDHTEVGLKIFTEDLHEVEQLPRPRVLDFLLRNHRSLALPYLEHVVFQWKDSNPLFHNALALQYREKVMQLLGSSSKPDEVNLWRDKLRSFLNDSEFVTPEAVLVHFPFDALFEERAILLGKLGKHEQALTIFMNVLQDYSAALKYCNRFYNADNQNDQEVYLFLLKLLLNPQICPPLPGLAPPSGPQREPDFESALKLLQDHASCIDVVQALTILPNHVPLARISNFLTSSLIARATCRRQQQLLRGLRYAEHLQVQEERIKYQSQKILMTEFNVCHVCKKRFGSQSIRRYDKRLACHMLSSLRTNRLNILLNEHNSIVPVKEVNHENSNNVPEWEILEAHEKSLSSTMKVLV